MVRAESLTPSTAAALIRMDGPAVNDCDGVKPAGFHAYAAPLTFFGDLNDKAFQGRHDIVQVGAGDLFKGGHHAAAVTAEADGQEFVFVGR